jgi:probable addiction module antidote protein
MSGRSRSYKEGLLRRLKDNSEAANYLQTALEDSSAAFLVALKNVLEARSVAAVARESNVSREHLYQMLTKTGNPRLSSLEKILHTLGLRLAIGTETEPAVQKPIEEPIWAGFWQVQGAKKNDHLLYRTDFSRVYEVTKEKEPASELSVVSRFGHSRSANERESEELYEMAC